MMMNDENLNVEELNVEELNLEEMEEVAGGKDANQKVKATGNANIRKGPSKDDDLMGSVVTGTKLPFLGIAKKDSRGVKWYKVTFNGSKGWISSKYAKII